MRVVTECLFHTLGLLCDRDRMHRAWLSYIGGDRRARAFSIDVVEHSLDRELAPLAVTCLDSTPLEDKLRVARAQLGLRYGNGIEFKSFEIIGSHS